MIEPSDETAPSSPEATAEPARRPPAPSRSAPSAGVAETPALQGAVPSQISLDELVTLAKSILSNREPPKETVRPPRTPAAAGRTLIPRTQKKFRKQEASPERTASRQIEEPEEEEDTWPTGPHSLAPTLGSISRERRPRSGFRRAVSRYWIPAACGLFAGLCISRFIASHAASPPKHGTAAPAGPEAAHASPPPSAITLQRIDEAMQASKAGDFAKAIDLFNQLQRSSSLPGVNYQLGAVYSRNGDNTRAVVMLNRSIDAGQEAAKSYLLLGAIMAETGKSDASLANYERAAHAEPFDAKAYFLWGEALRKAGQPRAALQRFGEAIDRTDNPDDLALFEFKRRLTLIEMDREGDFAAELATNLAADPVPPEWLLTAAAQAMRDGAYPAAADYLEKASRLMTPAALAGRLRDYFLNSFAFVRELQKFYSPPGSAVPNGGSPVAASPSPAPASGSPPAEPSRSPAPAAAIAPPPQGAPAITPQGPH